MYYVLFAPVLWSHLSSIKTKHSFRGLPSVVWFKTHTGPSDVHQIWRDFRVMEVLHSAAPEGRGVEVFTGPKCCARTQRGPKMYNLDRTCLLFESLDPDPCRTEKCQTRPWPSETDLIGSDFSCCSQFFQSYQMCRSLLACAGPCR